MYQVPAAEGAADADAKPAEQGAAQADGQG